MPCSLMKVDKIVSQIVQILIGLIPCFQFTSSNWLRGIIERCTQIRIVKSSSSVAHTMAAVHGAKYNPVPLVEVRGKQYTIDPLTRIVEVTTGGGENNTRIDPLTRIVEVTTGGGKTIHHR